MTTLLLFRTCEARRSSCAACGGSRSRPRSGPGLATVSRSLDQLGNRGVDLRAREVVELEALDDLVLAVGAGAREAADEALGDAVGAVGGHAHRDPVAVRAGDPVADVVDRRAGRRGGRGGAARLDDGGAAFADVRAGSRSRSMPGRRRPRRPARRRTWAWNRSGYMVGEWLPHTPICVMSVTGTAILLASCAIARLWSRRIIAVKRSRGMSGALFIAIRQLVLAGLPTTSTFRSSAALSLSALPCTVKILPFSREQLGALHALGARARADQQRDVDAVEGFARGCRAGRGRRAAGRRSRRAPSPRPPARPSPAGSRAGADRRAGRARAAARWRCGTRGCSRSARLRR